MGEVRYNPAQIRRIQSGVIAGTLKFIPYLNPVWVVATTLPRRGFDRPFQIYPPLRVIVDVHGLRYDVLLTQPFRPGPSGVWVVSAIVPHDSSRRHAVAHSQSSMAAIRVPHRSSEILRLQEAADRGNPRYIPYRDPIRVVAQSLQHLGFHTPIRIEPELTMLVLQGLESYDVTLHQPARKGVGGIWLVSSIRTHIDSDRDEDGD